MVVFVTKKSCLIDVFSTTPFVWSPAIVFPLFSTITFSKDSSCTTPRRQRLDRIFSVIFLRRSPIKSYYCRYLNVQSDFFPVVRQTHFLGNRITEHNESAFFKVKSKKFNRTSAPAYCESRQNIGVLFRH